MHFAPLSKHIPPRISSFYELLHFQSSRQNPCWDWICLGRFVYFGLDFFPWRHSGFLVVLSDFPQGVRVGREKKKKEWRQDFVAPSLVSPCSFPGRAELTPGLGGDIWGAVCGQGGFPEFLGELRVPHTPAAPRGGHCAHTTLMSPSHSSHSAGKQICSVWIHITTDWQAVSNPNKLLTKSLCQLSSKSKHQELC